jgi:hypothetical protein
METQQKMERKACGYHPIPERPRPIGIAAKAIAKRREDASPAPAAAKAGARGFQKIARGFLKTLFA